MSDDTPALLNRFKSLRIVNAFPTVDGQSPESRTELEDAIEQDLDAASEQVAYDRERFTKLESQVLALSGAVIVIAETSDAVEGAVQTVKDKMYGRVDV